MPKTKSALLISIRPKHAEKIFSGIKTVELRRVRPRLKNGDLVLVYVSSPTKALMGAFEVASVTGGSPRQIWKKFNGRSGLTKSEFNDYYEGAKQAFAVVLKKLWKFEKPVKLTQLRRNRIGFRPPQSYHYLTFEEANRIGAFDFQNLRSN
ncbi:MAG TPA: EVE domain-containing protein [Verrucomicrobiae bacterium]|jgi:predicted transcriptional regulator|nr:EVE domain-containing protein [Verrucomicrobiae bacterium]